MGIKEALNTFDQPGHYEIIYKEGPGYRLLVNVQQTTKNGMDSKLFVVPVQKSVYDMHQCRSISVHRLNWLGLLDVKKIESAIRTSTTIIEQKKKDLVAA